MFNGKKTYLVAAATVFGTIASAVSGAISWPDAAQLIVTAILGATLRNGMPSA